MFCCTLLSEIADGGFLVNSPLGKLANGRILTEIDTEYFLVFGDDRRTYVGLADCRLCGRAVSRVVWHGEPRKLPGSAD